VAIATDPCRWAQPHPPLSELHPVLAPLLAGELDLSDCDSCSSSDLPVDGLDSLDSSSCSYSSSQNELVEVSV